MTNEIKSTVYEVKNGRKWFAVRATSFKSLIEWAKKNGCSDYRFVGMMSNNEIMKSQNLEVVA